MKRAGKPALFLCVIRARHARKHGANWTESQVWTVRQSDELPPNRPDDSGGFDCAELFHDLIEAGVTNVTAMHQVKHILGDIFTAVTHSLHGTGRP